MLANLDPFLDDRLNDAEKGLFFLICNSKSVKEFNEYILNPVCSKLFELGYLNKVDNDK